jgi:hypothetical protein
MEKMENRKMKTYYQLILDRSGSMSDCIQPTVSGFNEQLQVLRSVEKRFPEQEVSVGLTLFNMDVVQVFTSTSPQKVEDLSLNNFFPDGSTALFDAVGETVMALKSRIQHEIEAGIATVVVVILTDGYENASKFFNIKGISALIKELEATGKWTFSYIGATIDAVQIAQTMNIKTENSMSFEKSQMSDTFKAVDDSIMDYMEHKRSGKDLSKFFKK